MAAPDYNLLLTEARRAWRIVVAYQQRVFFLLGEIEDSFPEASMKAWNPIYYKRPPAGLSSPMKGRWVWDGFPYYITDYTFVAQRDGAGEALAKGDWFMVIRVLADDGFRDSRDVQSDSFSGPDPLKFSNVENTESRLVVYLYRVHSDPITEVTRHSLWGADQNRDAKLGEWVEVAGMRSHRVSWTEPLADLFADGGTERLIQRIRAAITNPGKPLI